jgi:phage terminase large subunit-like protein
MTATANPPKRKFASLGPIIAEWMESNLVHTKGRWIGQPFKLMRWQRKLLNEMFEVEQQPDGSWQRRYRETLIGVPKKNGKTEFVAGLALYAICEDPEPAPEVYCAANSDKQADLVFGAAKTMCQLSPSLKRRTDPWKDTIYVKDRPGAKLVRVSAAVGTNDGLNVYWAIFDELHEFTDTKGRGVFDVLTNGQAGREQPFTISITTAGHELDSLCGEKYEFGKKVASGEITGAPFYFRWWEAPKDLDWKDPEAWEAANPSYGVTVLPAFYQEKIINGIRPATFKRFFLNVWTDAEDPWLPDGAWEACNVGPFAFDPAIPMWAGVDVGAFQDSTAVNRAQWQGDRLLMKAVIWEKPTNPTTGKPVDGWVLPIAEVENHLRELHETFDLQAVGFDRRFMLGSAPQLEAEGLPMVEIPQSNTHMVPAFKRFHELITQGHFGHDGDPTFARHIGNGTRIEVSGGEGGWRVTKKRTKKKIDACYGGAICIAVLDVQREDVTAPRSWTFEELPE